MENSFPLTPFDHLIHQRGNRTSFVYLFLSTTSIIVSWLIALNYSQSLTILLPLSITLGIVPFFVKKGATILYSWKEELSDFLKVDRVDIEKTCNQRFSKFAKVHLSIVVGSVFAITASFIYFQAGAFRELTLVGQIVGWLIFFVSTFICGMGLVSIVHLSLFFRDIGKFPVEVTNTAFGIMSAGNKLLSCYLFGCFAWCIYSFSGLGTIFSSNNPFYYLSIPSFIFLVGSFIFAQYPLHTRMSEYKKKRIQHIQKLMESVYPKEMEGVTKEQLELLSRLSDLTKEASQLPTWPSNYQTFMGAISSAFGAILPSLLSLGIDHYIN